MFVATLPTSNHFSLLSKQSPRILVDCGCVSRRRVSIGECLRVCGDGGGGLNDRRSEKESVSGHYNTDDNISSSGSSSSCIYNNNNTIANSQMIT